MQSVDLDKKPTRHSPTESQNIKKRKGPFHKSKARSPRGTNWLTTLVPFLCESPRFEPLEPLMNLEHVRKCKTSSTEVSCLQVSETPRQAWLIAWRMEFHGSRETALQKKVRVPFERGDHHEIQIYKQAELARATHGEMLRVCQALCDHLMLGFNAICFQ